MSENTEYITKTTIKEDYNLTDGLIKRIGEPDQLKPNPHYRKAAPMKLYCRERVEAWISNNPDAIAKTRKRQRAASKAVEAKREIARQQAAAMVDDLVMRDPPKDIDKKAFDFYISRYPDFKGLTQRGLCSFIRHNYTNYDNILQQVRGTVGAGEWYVAVKLYLCCLIIERYQLDLHPYEAAWGNNIQTTGDISSIKEEQLQILGITDEPH